MERASLALSPAMELPSAQAGDDDRLDVPGVIGERLLLGSLRHAEDAPLLKHLHVSVLLDAENPRKRQMHAQVQAEPTVDVARVELDYDAGSGVDSGMDAFRRAVATANDVIRAAREQDRTVFVFCTHGDNEGAVVCMAYLMVVEQWTLERSYRHVLQKRPASAPRKAYIEKLRALEKETHGRVTLRSDQVGPSMMDLMLGLQGQSRAADDADERCSQATDGGSSTMERASIVSNVSVTTGLHNGSSLRETMVIAEREEEADEGNNKSDLLHHPHLHGGSRRKKKNRDEKGCVIC